MVLHSYIYGKSDMVLHDADKTITDTWRGGRSNDQQEGKCQKVVHKRTRTPVPLNILIKNIYI